MYSSPCKDLTVIFIAVIIYCIDIKLNILSITP